MNFPSHVGERETCKLGEGVMCGSGGVAKKTFSGIKEICASPRVTDGS